MASVFSKSSRLELLSAERTRRRSLTPIPPWYRFVAVAKIFTSRRADVPAKKFSGIFFFFCLGGSGVAGECWAGGRGGGGRVIVFKSIRREVALQVRRACDVGVIQNYHAIKVRRRRPPPPVAFAVIFLAQNPRGFILHHFFLFFLPFLFFLLSSSMGLPSSSTCRGPMPRSFSRSWVILSA